MNRNRKQVLLLLPLVLLLGCGAKNVRTPVAGNLTSEQIARGVYEKLTAFLKAAQANHPECSAEKPTAKQGICPALQRGIKVQNRLADGINLYCGGMPVNGEVHYKLGGPCSPVLGAEPSLQSIMAEGLNVLSNLSQQLGGVQ